MEECISVFDMLKIGVGPSSSHTLGPWRAAERFLEELKSESILDQIKRVKVDLYGSLSLTGKGHATDLSVMLGLSGQDPEYIPVENIAGIIKTIEDTNEINLANEFKIPFYFLQDIVFNKDFLPFHANGLKFTAYKNDDSEYESTFYSIGGGFVVKEERENAKIKEVIKCAFPFPIQNAVELLNYTISENKSISEIVYENEKSMRSEEEIHSELMRIWNTMLECMYIGCHTGGILPGGLHVRRRAFDMHQNLIGLSNYNDPQSWLEEIRKTEVKFRQILKWVSCFALAVNEVNASLGRVVTAPTNGSAGVIPAVLMYYMVIENHDAGEKEIKQFLMVAGEIGSIFKKGSTISAAMGGCQAEIGVSSSMAAAALCELMGGTPAQVLMAAEIAMEHHLGLTCDPIGGLVQIPCIERNTMGAIKAINAAELALETDSKNAKVPLDKVINTMWETAKDMNSKYKETSEGGLAVAVNMADC
ncbi:MULTISPECIES: L-serine ammonia-lyase [Flavobacterium]|jgi:L-serine dehydratase|uniref:L-serine dehydratase n=2 Tax=Flavobacterium johnsoniae TaxID=986 RepID=A5FAQ3_FLAJ1|nr:MULTISPECIES: L-serine ammonia-lyase [Flavobacterium]ABQ07708.1 L-serine dehydratase 1 [Flavobacterium johnsoniae UW101]OXG01792.1 L-serine ammonia-lyase [Flavobacterium johnsoniae UW101]WDF58452.1 L-serine ammonia-lyase [Flavobacterium sp. KACC 22758]WQG80453.1 L-serine ammonia-lyase [Flavobacterium johnsoniae UW101]SHL04672.1 L-serine dehydratase [Flavobacterium johnsoniae]